ncbi:unnamed protein product [Lymnaea stagnalis]|uniref:PID domain-containing protein n=1 Tax=Lymnaea stagnalis TaxID=6523 RepID=A0AAV2HZU7_LYMST
MDAAKVAKDYFVSSQSTLLIPNRDYGSRKLISVGILRSNSVGSIKVGPPADEAELDTRRPQLNTNVGGSLNGSGVLDQVQSLKQKLAAMRSGNKQWPHPSDALLTGHILYTIKFLGECMVDQPKGTEVVRDAIRKMKFNKHLKRAEGQKPPKVELLISADAVTVLDPKSRTIIHQYPLHRISYCADDKSDKRMFTFIAKEANGNQHFCYVFDSERCAEEITLTIGQAFDLAYKRFLDSSTTDVDVRKQLLTLQKKVQTLQFENDTLRKRLEEVEKLKDRSDIDAYKRKNQITDLQKVSLSLRESSTDDDEHPSTPTKPASQTNVVGRRLENLMLHTPVNHSPSHKTNSAQPSNNLTTSQGTPILSPPPSNTRSNRANSLRSPTSPVSPALSKKCFIYNDPFAIGDSSIDPFGMGEFNPTSGQLDREFKDIQAGFRRGLSFGTDDFTLEQLDPLNQKI